MGRGGRGRGQGGRGKDKWQANHKSGRSSSENGWDEWEADDRAAPDQADTAQAWQGAGADLSWGLVPQGQLPRPLATQWRFFCRVLHRHAPQEQVHDWRRQLRLGDHIFIYYSWDFSEQHGIVCSVGEDNHGRRGAREEPPWVVHVAGSRLACVSLPQFSRGGELFRVNYPHWVCQCHVPSSPVVKPHVTHEQRLEPETDARVADKAHSLYTSGAYAPTWTQAQDLEFCIRTKTGGVCPRWELHSRQAVSAGVLPAIGCAVKGEQSPSKLFGNPDGSGSNNYVTPPPGYAPQWAPPPAKATAPAHPPAASSEAPASEALPAAPGWTAPEWFNGGWCNQSQTASCPEASSDWNPALMTVGAADFAAVTQAQDASARAVSTLTTLSADAAVFVPRNWDGIYQ
mmetsp:Transcript_13578/g.30930  ORF Transcript_13578/g.30930 Transcript_13578/m.30930 type:complete len:400 (+) Transcript_13578:58-1257(+)